MKKLFPGIHYFKRYGGLRFALSFNEGEGPINFCLHWRSAYRFVYVYLFGMRWSKYIKI